MPCFKSINCRIPILTMVPALIIGFTLCSKGQSDFKILNIPQKFIVPTDESDLKDDKIYFEGYSWTVYSDREFNKSYTQPGSDIPLKKLDNLEAYQVVEWKKNYLHIVKMTQNKEGSGTNLEDYGWVEMSKLLLWNHCLVNPDNYCNKKAIVIYSERTGYLFEKKAPGDDALNFRVLYIYKSFGDKYLIGTSPRLPKDAQNVSGIIDWVEKDLMWEWDEIEAVEPNCHFRKQLPGGKYIATPVIFKSEGAAGNYAASGTFKEKDLLWSNDSCEERMPATWLRFPILTNEGQVITVGIFPGYYKLKGVDGGQLVKGYCALEQDMAQTMFTKVIFTSQEELGKIVSIYNSFFELVGPAPTISNVAETWKSILLEERYDQRNKDQSLLTFQDINRMLFSYNHSNFLPADLPMQVYSAGANASIIDIELYLKHLDDNLVHLKEILNEKKYEIGFFSNTNHYYWLPARLLP
jgi:hypothetical protein